MFCSSTYSSNVKVILFPVKLSAESFGFALSKRGGKESLGPPCGGMILAHPESPIKPIKEIIKTRKNDIAEYCFIKVANLTRFMAFACKCFCKLIQRDVNLVYRQAGHCSVSSSCSCRTTARSLVLTKLHQWQSSFPQPV